MNLVFMYSIFQQIMLIQCSINRFFIGDLIMRQIMICKNKSSKHIFDRISQMKQSFKTHLLLLHQLLLDCGQNFRTYPHCRSANWFDICPQSRRYGDTKLKFIILLPCIATAFISICVIQINTACKIFAYTNG